LPLKSVDKVLVIDGNSTDGTQDFYKRKKVPVYTQTIPGLGGATFEARKHCNSDAMIFYHPDGNEEPADIAKVAELLRSGHKFVIPSRMIAGGRNEEDLETFRPRKWFNMSLAYFVNYLWNDYSIFNSEIVQGFRGIDVATFDKLRLNRTDLTMDFHMVIRALKYKVLITEFPTIEHDRLFGETNFSSLSTGWKELKMLYDEIFNSETYVKN
jgi:glycosyltransferase involved in cell wall biosynthesis